MAVNFMMGILVASLMCLIIVPKCDAWGLMGLFKLASPSEICYKKYGCFSTEKPFTNTKGILPEKPPSMGVRFLLYTRKNPRKAKKLKRCGKREDLLDEKFPKPTKMIIHGYVDKGRKDWVRRMTREIIKNADVNVIVIDWRRGAMTLNYLQAAANTRLVGAIAAVMVEKLNHTYNIQPSMIHIIGHSLGAHIAGYIGERVPRIARITGLDPAGPAFEDTDSEVRLDSSDADFVDVIHTDADSLVNTDMQPGFGTKQPMGDMDFYPNNGNNQPGCANSIGDNLMKFFSGNNDFVGLVTCNHIRVLRLFTESINTPCQFHSYPCALEHLGSAKCDVCGARGCAVMGYHAQMNRNRTGTYNIPTSDKSPFCLE